MKPNTFKFSILTVGVVAAMSMATGANAAEATAVSKDAAPINNQATASYSVGTVTQPVVTSNTVTVNVSETANFSLVATIAEDSKDDNANKNQTAVPGGTTQFDHALTNTGNVTDTYTITTTGNDSDIDTASPNYALSTSDSITYTIVQNNGTALTSAQATALPAGQSQTGTLTNGGTIKLPPGYRANLSYLAATPTTQTGGQKGVGTLTATSTFFTNASAAKSTLVNENQTIVKLPVFKIEKTATCGTSSPCTTLDLNSTTPQITYTIKVTNVNTAYSDTATNFIVRDVLPAGMTAVTPLPTDVTTTTNAGIQTLSKTIASLAPGASETITFIVNVAKASYTAANSSATNNATVYDRFNATLPVPGTDTNGYDIVDSTDTVAANNVTRIPDTADTSGGIGEDTASTIKFSRRNLMLAEATTREIAPLTSTENTDGQVTHQVTITNSGQDIEGNSTNPLTLTITDGSNAEVNPVPSQFFLVYTPPNGTPIGPYRVTPEQSDNVYTISSSTFSGSTFPSNLGIEPGGKLAVSYNMASTDAVIGSSESTVVELTADGINAPAIAAITDTTNVQGLKLEKFQALDIDCDGTISGTGEIDFTKDEITEAAPDQCVIYRIDATNTSTAAPLGFNITGLTISDALSKFSAGADLVSGSATSSATTGSTIADPTENNTSVSATASTLAPQGVATLKFRVKIKNNRTVTP